MEKHNVDADTSECEFVSVNEVATNTKGKRNKNRKASNKKHDAKPPLAPPATEVPSIHTKKKRSEWWVHFQDSGVEDVVECKYCLTRIGCSSTNGTTPLKNHALGCKQNPERLDKKQKLIDLESKTHIRDDGSVQTTSVPRLWEFNPEVIRKALSKMLIVDELPFSFVEREGFRDFCKTMNAHFNVPSRSTATRDCYSYFIKERKSLLNIFQNLSSRVCLTTDTWTSGQNLCYMCLTAHFIDDDWRLHKKIINFCPIVGHSGILIGRSIEKCLIEWKLKNILTVTVDNASSNDVAINHLKKVFNHWESGVLKGSFLHMRCAAHILNLVVKDGLTDVNLSIKKIRAIVKYVRSSPARLQKFKACIEEESSTSSTSIPNPVWGQGAMDIDAMMTKRFEMAMGSSESTTRKTELDKYLGEDREPVDLHFDVLTWWKVKKCRYPILAKMARDILAIPVSTVASESAFSTGGQVLDCFRTALTPRMVEALVCKQDWTRTSHNPIMVEDILLEIENMEEEGLKDLIMDQPIIMIDETIDELEALNL